VTKRALLASGAAALVLAAAQAFAQNGPGRPHGGRGFEPPDYRQRHLSVEDRQRLRQQVLGGQMSREEAREQWRARRSLEAGRSPQQREQLRRDVTEYGRDLERR